MPEQELKEEEYSFYNLFIPLTTKKAIWLIIFIGLIVYFNGLFNPFQLDDFTQIVNNPAIFHVTNIPMYFYTAMGNAKNAIPTMFSVQFRPLLYTIYTLIGSLFGANPFLFHFLQLLIHIANTILLFYLFSRFLNQRLAFFICITFFSSSNK